MTRFLFRLLGVWLMLAGSARAQLKPETIQRGKHATALVEVSLAKADANGSAFCVDPSGLFVTNAHVVEGALDEEGSVRLVVDIGSTSQRTLPAKALRHDDRLDLALLQVNADPHPTPLELGRDADMKELEQVFTFGYPFGKATAVGRAEYPDITILPSHITSLRRDKGELVAVQFDNQINPGNSGGPVLDESGRVVGVAQATVPGAALNTAISVGRLADFLKAPGLDFDPPAYSYLERARPMTWTIRLQPATPGTRRPEDVSVAVTLSNRWMNRDWNFTGGRRTYAARPVGEGAFEVTVTPAAHDPDWSVFVSAVPARGGQLPPMRVKDEDVRGGGTRFMMRVLRTLLGGRSPRAPSAQGESAGGPILRLGKVKTKFGNETVTIDLTEQEAIRAGTNNPPRAQTVLAEVEAKQGTKVLATVRQRQRLVAPFGVTTGLKANLGVSITPRPLSAPVFHRPPVDEGLLKLGGVLDADGVPRGSGQAIRPPRATIPAARLTPGSGNAPDATLVRRLDGTISDVAVGGGGRFLLLTLKDVQTVVIFDVNVADVVKKINLPAPNALVAAGARKALILFPEEMLLQRWDLATLQRDGGARASPIEGRVRGLALGSDSDGPALALWLSEKREIGLAQARFSFIDLDTLTVPRAGLVAVTGRGGTLSTSGGTFTIGPSLTEEGQCHLRAATGSTMFGLWSTDSSPTGFQILSVYGTALLSSYAHINSGHVLPSADGRTVFTGLEGRLDLDGQPIGRPDSSPLKTPLLTIPSADHSYYLEIGGLPPVRYSPYATARPNPSAAPEELTASVHAADGARLLTVHGLDEMAGTNKEEEVIKNDFTIDKRFHFVPAAQLLITIPAENDRLVLRRLDLDEALDRAGANYLIVTSAPILAAQAGRTLDHRVVARSKKGGITYELADGPEGLSVAPDGKLTWAVPMRLSGEDVTAVVKVHDASGQERSHSILFRVR